MRPSPTGALEIVLRDLAKGIAAALRDGRSVDNDLRYSLIWQSLSRHGWDTLGVRGESVPSRDAKIAPRNSGNAVDRGIRVPPQEKPSL